MATESQYEFPLTVYDRPGISLSNLFTGNLDAATRAIFAPMTLSPDEMKNIRQRYLQGTDNHPIIKTILDVTTNPIFIGGIIMSLGPWGKVASVGEINKIVSGMAGMQKMMNPMMRALGSSFTSLRSIWHLDILSGKPMTEVKNGLNVVNALVDHNVKMTTFEAEGMDTMHRALAAFQKATGKAMSRTQANLAQFWAQGFHHLPKVKELGEGKVEFLSAPHQAYYAKHYGSATALMPELEGIMKKEGGQPLLDFAKTLQQQYKRYYTMILKDPNSGAIHDQLLVKGTSHVGDYAPEVLLRNPLDVFMSSSPTMTPQATKGILERVGKGGFVKGHLKERIGNAIPEVLETTNTRNEILQKHGVDLFGEGMWDKYSKLTETQVNNVQKLFTDIVNLFRRNKIGVDWQVSKAGDFIGPDKKAPEVVEKVLGDSWQILKKQFELREGRSGMAEGAARMTRILQTIANMPEAIQADELASFAKMVGAPAEYKVNALEAYTHYVKSMAPTYAWYSPAMTTVENIGGKLTKIYSKPLGQALTETISKLDPIYVPDAKWIQDYFNTDLAPHMNGMKTLRQMMTSQTFRDTALKLQQWVMSSPIAQTALPKATRENLVAMLNGAKGGITAETIGRELSGSVYTGALGLNLSPVSKNEMQGLLGTIQILGPKNYSLGLKRAFAGIPKFLSSIEKVGLDRAIREAWPEYYKAFRGEGISAAAAIGDVAEEEGLRAMSKGIFNKVKQGIMTPFAISEKMNRLIAFYGAHEAMLIDGATAKQASRFATWFNYHSNFVGGPLGISNWARNVWTPFRQFGHFPSRMMESIYTNFRMGPGGQFSTGVLGRTLATSAGVYTIMKNMAGVDTSGGLFFGALPGPVNERSSFYPAPYVPPVIGAAGDVIKAFDTGDFSKLPRTAALFVPGGLGISRMWRTWAPKYADYTKRNMDGTIPIYNEEGALIKNMTPGQLALKGLGIRTVAESAEPQMMQYVLAQREKIRGYRKSYMEALGSNDLEKARKINEEFRRRYPTFGDLQIKKADIKAMETRKETSRLQRAIKGFPKDYQPIFESLVSYNHLNNMTEIIDSAPDSLRTYLE